MKSLMLAGAALALFGAAASAQSQSGKAFARYNKPLKSVSLDLATGTITHGPVVGNRSATTTIDFDNNDLGGFVAVDTGNCFCEWFDAAIKGAINQSDCVNDIVFAYCSAKLSPNSGGPGGNVKLGFYEGYTVFGGAPTTAVAVFTLTGLPGNTASSSFAARGFRCYFIRVIFANLVSFADGPIGYSWKFIDVGTTGVLGATWPFLSCVTSCSGLIGQVDGKGMVDAIDEYCPPGFLLATFTFGSANGTFTSMSMDIREDTDFPATIVQYDACTTPNATNAGGTLTASKAILKGTWTATIVRTGVSGGIGSITVRVGAILTPCNGIAPPAGVSGRTLIIGTKLAPPPPLSGAFGGGNTVAISAGIPGNFGLLCLHFACQGTVAGGTPGGIKLTSAAHGTTGTQ